MAKRASIATRLYRGELSFAFIDHRKRWYIASGILILVSQLERKNFGRAYESLRLNEDLAASLGIEVRRQPTKA